MFIGAVGWGRHRGTAAGLAGQGVGGPRATLAAAAPHVGALAVSPEAGTAVVFDSFHGHEVLPSKRRRYALTLWLFHEPLGV